MIEARLNSELGGIYGMRGDYPRAQHHFEHSLRLREAVDDLPGMIFSHNNLGYLWQLQSEYERAIGHYQIAEELARKINLRFALVFAALNTAYALSTMGMYTEAEARCAEALTLSREMNAQQNIAQIHNTLGYIFYHKGDYERALAAYDEALQINHSLGSTHQEANNLMNKALTLNAMNSFDLATDAAREALVHAEALQGQLLKVEALNALAEAALGGGDLVMASEYAEEASTLGDTIGSKRDVGVSRRLLGQLAAANGERFADDFEKSVALFEAIKDRFELARTWAAYGIALVSTGNETGGQAYLKQAWNAFVAIGAHGEVQRLASTVERSV
jgi:adenylate cyclase